MRGSETDVIAAVVARLAVHIGATVDAPTNWPEGATSNRPAILTFTDTWRDSEGTTHTAASRQLPVFVGRKWLSGQEWAPPRIVLYLGKDLITGAASPNDERESLPRTLALRQVQFVAQCWGGDYGEAGALYQALFNAFHDTATTNATLFNFQPTDGEWEPNGEAGAWTTTGEALYHAFQIDIPIVTPDPPTTRQGPPELTERIL